MRKYYRLTLGTLSALALLSLFVGAGDTASAQTTPSEVIMVGNSGKPHNQAIRVGGNFKLSQSFCTGSTSSTLRKVRLYLSDPFQMDPSVALYSADSRHLIDLTNPTTFDSSYSTADDFTSTGYTLAANTTYQIVVQRNPDSPLGWFRMSGTYSKEIDSGGAPGWWMGRSSHTRFRMEIYAEGAARTHNAPFYQRTCEQATPSLLVFELDENPAAGQIIGSVAAEDHDGDTLAYSPFGEDSAAFNSMFQINSQGQISVRNGVVVDYEQHKHYELSIGVTDSEDASGNTQTTPTRDDSVPIYVDVENLDEAGTATLSTSAPKAGLPITADVSDPDVVFTRWRGPRPSVFWQWARGDSATGTFTDTVRLQAEVFGTSVKYLPRTEDIGKFLRATVYYADRQGLGKSAVTTIGPVTTVAPSVKNVQILWPPGSDNEWNVGDQVMAKITFDQAVTVNTASGTPSVKIRLGMNTQQHNAPYLRGSGHRELVFGYTLTAGQGLPAATHLVQNSLALNGGSISGTESLVNATLTHSGATLRIPMAQGQDSPQNSAATGAPTIAGTARVGETLTASIAGISDEDGISDAVFTYQWLADDETITGATNSSYIIGEGLVGSSIKVRVSFTDNGGNTETLTSVATAQVADVNLELQSAKVDGTKLTLTYNQSLDLTVQHLGESARLPTSAFSVSVAGTARSVSSAEVSGLTVGLTLASAVTTGQSVTVSYTKPDGNSFIRDTRGRIADSFDAQDVTNETAPPQLTASSRDVPAAHDGSSQFTFELRLSENLDISYRMLQDSAFTVTGGSIVGARRLDPPSNTRWEIKVQPSSDQRSVNIVLPATTDCDDEGAICLNDDRKLSNRLEISVNAPNSPATGAPTISGVAQVGQTLTASTSGIDDSDGMTSPSFTYIWLAGDTEISGATGSSYTLTASEQGDAIKVKVSFTDDEGNNETLTSAATATVAPPPLTSRSHAVPSSHDGSSQFTFELRFSENLDLSYLTLKDSALTVTGGSIIGARRLDPPSNTRWEITVLPSSDQGSVTIILPATTECQAQGAICLNDERKLSNRLEISVPGQ